MSERIKTKCEIFSYSHEKNDFTKDNVYLFIVSIKIKIDYLHSVVVKKSSLRADRNAAHQGHLIRLCIQIGGSSTVRDV